MGGSGPRLRLRGVHGVLARGGTAGLDTVGGEVERLARERSGATVATLAVTLVLKLGAGALALMLALRDRPPRWAIRLGLVASIGLALYGGLLVAAGALALAGLAGSRAGRGVRAALARVLLGSLVPRLGRRACPRRARRARTIALGPPDHDGPLTSRLGLVDLAGVLG